MYCPNGHANADAVKFCGECGVQFVQSSNSDNYTAAADSTSSTGPDFPLNAVKPNRFSKASIAIAGLVLIGVLSGGAYMIFSSRQTTPKPTYSVHFVHELFGTTCSDLIANGYSFNYQEPVRVIGPKGQQIAIGTFGAGISTTDIGKSGKIVDVCRYTAVISGITEHLGAYVFADGGRPVGAGLSFTEKEVEQDNVGIVQGYDLT